jgi:hypothetical protein
MEPGRCHCFGEAYNFHLQGLMKKIAKATFQGVLCMTICYNGGKLAVRQIMDYIL